ncbi:hypothetical protein EXY23_09705 [Roseicella aquatilis]|uniref:Flagellar biosynthetic protein FliO n=2 Tax=Roseicella aquatilis TaxID=2527868 RepID=A0A4R4DPE9_9PROT|nr:hypothetical protein EXY23_09705 [Roseicella aquatilis]
MLAKALLILAGLVLPLAISTHVLRGRGAGPRVARRLAVQEMVALDAKRRLVLVRCDGRELLLLTGGAQDTVLGWLPERSGR